VRPATTLALGLLLAAILVAGIVSLVRLCAVASVRVTLATLVLAGKIRAKES